MQILVCILLLNVARYCSSEETLGEVVFANILYRHGDTTPVESYPNDPYKNESSWPVPFGQLTNIGKHQHLMLGRWLRKRYARLLSPEYSVNEIYVSSSDDDRTLMSAEANLAGLYSPAESQVLDMKKWIPIPVHSVPEDEDVLAGTRYCERYSDELGRVGYSPEIRLIDRKNADLYDYLSRMTGKKISSLEAVELLYNTLYIEELHNKTLPEWTKNIYPSKLKPLAEKNFAIPTYNKFLQKLKSGPLLKDMIEHMQLKSKNKLTPSRKLWMYSAHDHTIANMLMTLGVFEPQCPPYAATLLIELRINDQNNHVVTIFYKNSTEEPFPLTIPGCIAACPLDQFVKLTEDVIPDDWEWECLDSTLFYVVTVFEIGILLGAFIFLHWRRRFNCTRAPRDEPRRIPQQNANINPVIEIIHERYA